MRTTSRPGVRQRARFAIAAALVGVLGSGFMVWQSSQAAFSGSTANPGNSWAAGAVTMTDDDGGIDSTSGTAMFTASGLTPSSPASVKCIKVTYTGSVSAPVKLYGGSLTGTLAPYLNLSIEMGTGGAFSSCAGFTGAAIYNSTVPAATPGTLASFDGGYTSYANGLATGWTPTTNGDSKVFRFTTSVKDDNTANGTICGSSFTWEAQA